MSEQEAKCPRCGQWSAVEWDDSVPPGGWWWTETAGCPMCSADVMVESEREFREVKQ